ncbi:MAG: DUF4974 domain-containing protein [Cytophagales bacterium]|nr:DUF4974 domain-containing protein [Cytophagales bacterium]
MKYRDYAVEDFVKDEFFVSWVKNKHAESDHFWKIWIQNNPEKLETVNMAISIIKSIGYKHRNELSGQEYAEVFEGIIKNDKDPYKNTSVRKIFPWRSFAAAVIISLFIGSLLFIYFNRTNSSTREVTYLTKNSPVGVKTTIKLNDGSVVKLNAGGSLKFPDEFSANQRLVYLEGEAFFEVIRDETRPFLVMTNEIVTKVLGTSFNVKSNSENQRVEVALVAGKVSVSDQNGNSFVLRPREMVTFASNNIAKGYFDHDLVVGWTQNKLVFAKASDREVVDKLENWYGVSFVLRDGYMFKDDYSGVFENESLENVLKGISYTSDFIYEIKDKTVIISH